jgi:hypothetical protein
MAPGINKKKAKTTIINWASRLTCNRIDGNGQATTAPGLKLIRAGWVMEMQSNAKIASTTNNIVFVLFGFKKLASID